MEGKRVSVFFKCWIGDVTPAIADVQIIPRNIISKNIVIRHVISLEMIEILCTHI
jgi:hypothetical protein